MGNRYEEYEQKIIKRARIRKFFYRFRFAFIIPLSFAVASGGTLVGTRGLVKDNKMVANQVYVYGDEYEYSSSAFLSETSYEFTSYDEENWMESAPKLVGKYKMRSKGKNSFSSYYYGQEQSFEIVPREINVSVKEDSITYGETPTIDISSQLVSGDSLDKNYQIVNVEDIDYTKDKWGYIPVLDSLKIVSSSGEDVTDCYSISVTSKDVDILKRTIHISTSSASKTYDGTVLYNHDYECENNLVEGDELVFVSASEIIKVGNKQNEMNFIIKNNGGLDMTSHYNVIFNNGNLTVNKRPVTFTTADKEYVYDGLNKKFALEDISYLASDIATNQEVVFNYVNDDKFIKVGEYSNSFTAKIIEGDTDVSDNYEITYEIGKTTITKRDITVKADDYQKTYDNEKVKIDTYQITDGSLADKDEITVTEASEFVESGKYENKLSITINDKETKEDFTDCYNFVNKSGEIVIDPVKIQVEIIQKEVVYDGKKHKNDYQIKDGKLVGEDYISVLKNEEKIDAGTYDNDTFAITINNKEDKENISNYDLEIVGRKDALIINKRPITLTVLGKEKLYDAKKMSETLKDDTDYYELTSGTLADDEYIDFKYLNDPTDAGIHTIQKEISVYHQVGENPDKSKDEVVTSNYDINVVDNSFTINKRTLSIRTLDIDHVYDRKKEIPTDKTVYEIVDGVGDGLLTNHKIRSLDVTCDSVDVGDYSYDIDKNSLVIEDKNTHVDVTKNYDVTFVNDGRLTITKRPIEITMTEKHWIYDASEHSSNAHKTINNLLKGDTVTFSDLPTVKYVTDGHVTNNPGSYTVLTSTNEDVTSNYEVTFVDNQDIYIDPRPITVQSCSISKVFDGDPIDPKKEVSIKAGSLATGDKIEILSMDSFDNSYTHKCNLDNEYTFKIVDANGDDMTANYDITKEYGKIEIKPYELTIGLKEQVLVYDGASHNIDYHESNVTSSSETIFLIGNEMLSGCYINIDVTSDGVKNAGAYTTSLNVSFSVTSDWADPALTTDFIVTTSDATVISILQRTITIQTLGGTKIYDGEAFGSDLDFDDLVWISSGSLVTGDYIAGYIMEGVVNICENAPNVIYDIVIKDALGNEVTYNYQIIYIYGQVSIYED